MKRKFSTQGLLALAPPAIDAEFDRAKPKTELTPALAIVTVRGPLCGHSDPDGFFDSYEDIRQRVSLALASDAPTVVLLIDSPGGLASGCLELSKDLRARVANAGKRLVAYVDGQACSAAYALACAASKVYVGESSTVGSVGIVDTLLDQTALNRASGLRVEVVASGVRKADGNPNTPMSKEAIEASRARVEQLAATFFELVGKARGMNAAKVRALEAGVFMGSEAMRVGLADQVCTFDEMLALVGGKASPQASGAAIHAARAATAQHGAMAIAGTSSPTSARAAVGRTASVSVTHRAPARAVRSAPLKPNTKKGPIMSTPQLQAVAAEQRAAYFDKHPGIPEHLKEMLASEPMTMVRQVVEAYEGADAAAQSLESKLFACMRDPSSSELDRRAARRALAALALTAEQIQDFDPIGWKMGTWVQSDSKCMSTNGGASIALGVPVYRPL